MTRIHYVAADSTRMSFDVENGISVMQGAVLNGVQGIVGECGGNAMCATCHVYVDKKDIDRLETMDELEDEMLDSVAGPRRENSRLSCQIKVSAELEGLTVYMPDRQY
ncbi:2Fe-2S iron-sulfur cluster-binding protein [Bradyrhizobium yuanmingense]|uniref:2Fe-2S iron-sulfur cluster-binding protein n=1 Tax=Bradyrhizobium yuanmingense TaxID=108015 RepID=UPI0023B985E1|nr:2Fe-2S iron-sulfur cluster-binding protein [Bradyrhizobium yuanmingense]MDF0523329.1 2Fe-2S iron-sulfur cluster-binding protein [Bradyrhizobium yuanmingense]